MANYPGTATFAMILTDCWQWILLLGILFAGLESIPIEPYELAKMDGGNRLKFLSNFHVSNCFNHSCFNSVYGLTASFRYCFCFNRGGLKCY